MIGAYPSRPPNSTVSPTSFPMTGIRRTAVVFWPDQKSLVKQTGAVVAVSIVLGVMIALLDFIFQYGVDILVNISF